MVTNTPGLEIDWWNAWYGAWATWDSTISFWLTATFAVIVATHALGASVTPRLTRLLASLYGAFSIYTVLRGSSVYLESNMIAAEITKMELEVSELSILLGRVSDVVIALVVVLGSVATVYFVLSAHNNVHADGE